MLYTTIHAIPYCTYRTLGTLYPSNNLRCISTVYFFLNLAVISCFAMYTHVSCMLLSVGTVPVHCMRTVCTVSKYHT